MSANEIASLCENLSIKDEDGAIHQISEEMGIVGVEDVDHCLVGKVLSGKKVNREAFKSVIEHLWSPFGNVEIEVVGENVFMFFFNNSEDRNRVWGRGPWHFDKCLLVLEKPTGTGEITKIAKWMAEQIGEVIEIPTESRDCWGKFLRIKVRIDISKPLKRWLRLSLDKSGNIVVVGLKYERFPEFCYACGRVGHGINECADLEAKKVAMEGNTPRFGSWMRATQSEKSREKSSSQISGGSSVKERSQENNQEMEKTGFLALKASSISAIKTARRKSLSPTTMVASSKFSSGKGKLKTGSFSQVSSSPSLKRSELVPESEAKSCKRRVDFNLTDESKDIKKLKVTILENFLITSAEPGSQARREP
ncbi:hypothetical protein EZV62_022368 [Acer yangbiense]|uniref:CCHC-type domain-containing protein n=1 Tax=Acer yangbiense TaxID=1000413 RepID=A0A5C7H8X5_9ROSI|nr:hypothetical protein EZV62_022368 [Acer yangbiense]